MKRLLLSLLWAMIATLPQVTRAQLYAHVPPVAPPSWAPPGHTRAQYYYLPDLQVYYDVPAANFLLPNRGQWIALRQLPPMYRSYDLHAAPKVVLDYYGPYPFRHYEEHRQRFPRWYCQPHSVVVYRHAPASTAPRGHLPDRRHRHHYKFHDVRRDDEGCNRGSRHEGRTYNPKEGEEPSEETHYGDGDRPYAPERHDDQRERK